MLKQLSLLIIIAVLMTMLLSCTGRDNRAFANKLEELGFWKYADANTIAFAKRQIIAKGWAGVFVQTGRLFPADAEALAEGGVGSFLHEIWPFLQSQDVSIPAIEEQFEFHKDYLVRIGDKSFLIYSREESSAETWGLSTARCFAMVNALLESMGSSERMYAVNSGNDLFAMFLTQELYRVICEHPAASPSDSPYIPTEEYPRFGQPE